MLLFQLSVHQSIWQRRRDITNTTTSFSFFLLHLFCFLPLVYMNDGDQGFFLPICVIVATYSFMSKAVLYQVRSIWGFIRTFAQHTRLQCAISFEHLHSIHSLFVGQKYT